MFRFLLKYAATVASDFSDRRADGVDCRALCTNVDLPMPEGPYTKVSPAVLRDLASLSVLSDLWKRGRSIDSLGALTLRVSACRARITCTLWLQCSAPTQVPTNASVLTRLPNVSQVHAFPLGHCQMESSGLLPSCWQAMLPRPRDWAVGSVRVLVL